MKTQRAEPAVQVEMSFNDRQKKKSWGGSRAGAGRPRSQKKGIVRHSAREPHKKRFPVHVTIRVVGEVGSLRTSRVFAKVRDAIRRAGVDREGFRIVHFSVQSNHLHLIVEASDERRLGRGMQGLAISIAKRVNRLLGRKGPVLSDRYHRHDLKTARETRNAIAYVLQNRRKHLWERRQRGPSDRWDSCSSGNWFDGWRDCEPAVHRADEPRLVSPPSTWLLEVGWRRWGLIRIDEIPGQRQHGARHRSRSRS